MDLTRYLAAELSALPAVTRHGDFWLGNLLVNRGRLSGVVDWDGWHAAGVPGTDLMHFLGTELALRTKREIGEIWLRRPWRSDAFTATSRQYWRSLGLSPTVRQLDAVAIASWAGQLAHDIGRQPQLALDGRWVTANVERVIQGIER
jgi:aminoglycoside phosphotransferase (APT) family kinase protein